MPATEQILGFIVLAAFMAMAGCCTVAPLFKNLPEDPNPAPPASGDKAPDPLPTQPNP